MRKILITAHNLDYGGIETSLITLLKTITSNYEITLLLEEKKGVFLKDVPSNVKIIDYNLRSEGNVLKRKITNRLNLIKTIKKLKGKFDVAISYAPYSIAASIIVRNVCKRNYLWVHNDYIAMDKVKATEFFEAIKASDFQNLVFVSQKALDNYQKNFLPKNNLICCRNLIDVEKIYKLAKEKITFKKKNFVFLNVSRHDKQKKLERIIEAASLLEKEKLNFTILFLGDGPDREKYQEMVKAKHLENTILFLGAISNPYPYYKLCDAVILSSDYEGFPVVFSEALALNKPIVTTDVSDAKLVIGTSHGVITDFTYQDIAKGMQKVMAKDYHVDKFDVTTFNKEIYKTLAEILGDENEI